MGTTYTVKIVITHQIGELQKYQKAIQAMLDGINDSMSTYLKDSELSKINRNRGGDWIKVSDELYEVIDAAMQVSHLSGGAFDITVGPLVNLWGFGPDKSHSGEVPDQAKISALLKSTGSGMIMLDKKHHSIMKKKSDVYLDLSGIAKGYAVDAIARLLEQKFMITDYMVEIGGEIRAKGHNTDGNIWQIGIEKPSIDSREAENIITLENLSMATSGDYRNYFEKNNVRYSHEIDPATGYPIHHNLASVTVINPQCMIADAWATALMVMGLEQGSIAAENNNLAAIFITRNHDTTFTVTTSTRYRELITE